MSTPETRASDPASQSVPSSSATPQPGHDRRVRSKQLFRSFWLGGFEAASHVNQHGQRIDMLAATQHDVQAEHDYALMKQVGIETVRDGTRWHLIEQRPGRYDFSSLAPMVAAAERQNVQVIWDLCHYGWPDDLDVFSAEFIKRYVSYSQAVARFLRERSDEPLLFTPINEISFLTWGVCVGNLMAPFAPGRDHELKRQLVRAVIAVSEALWEIDPRTRFIHGDPILHVVADPDDPDAQRAAAGQNESQYEGWDLLAGLREPDLGGHPRYLDTIGLNYYFNNQWLLPDGYLDWETDPPDPRRVAPHLLIQRIYQRYRCRLLIGETSHVGAGRARWLRHMTDEVYRAIELGVPVGGICLYPIIDRPDWNDANHWHNSGLFDLMPDAEGRLARVVCPEYLTALREAQQRLPLRPLRESALNV